MGSALKVLLDTHTAYWVLYKPSLASATATAAIRDAEISFISLVTFWEAAIKTKVGKLDAASMLEGGPLALQNFGFATLSIKFEHIHRTLQLPLHHRDPFDRLLIAQALSEGLAVVSSDAAFDPYGVERIW